MLQRTKKTDCCIQSKSLLKYASIYDIINLYTILIEANLIFMSRTYEPEARSRWGATDAYREHEQKTKNYTKEKWAEVNDGMMAIFAELAACQESGADADSAEAQALVAKLQAHITKHYYTCTDEILAGLGKMYVADERFKKNIDKCGDGTAEFVANAFAAYVK